MESRKIVLMNLWYWWASNEDTDIEHTLADMVQWEADGMNKDSSIGTYALPYGKQTASGSLLHDAWRSALGSITT